MILNIQRTQDGTICIPLHAFYPAEDGIDCSRAHKLADLIQIPVGKRYLYSKIEADFIQINEKECLFLD